MMTSRGGLGVFLSAVFRRPAAVGTVLPSSPALATRLAAVMPDSGQPVVVELGAGTGSVSRVIARRLPPGAQYIAVELDEGMAAHLQATAPAIDVVQADAADLDHVLRERGIDRVDFVLSGLPWSLITPIQQRRILRDVATWLSDTGVFITFTYLLALPLTRTRMFRACLRELFGEISVTRVWRNVPPGVIHTCRRPRRGGNEPHREA